MNIYKFRFKLLSALLNCRKFPVFLAVLIFFLAFHYSDFDSALAKTRYVTLGAGEIGGSYYPVGRLIGQAANKKRKQYQLRVTVRATEGSVQNIKALINGDLEFGLAQADQAYQAWHGLAQWRKVGPQKDLRSVFSLYTESLALITSVESGITNCGDLKGRKVAVGLPGSGTRQNSIDALAFYGLTLKDLGQAVSVSVGQGVDQLLEGKLEALFYTVGHPSPVLLKITAKRKRYHFIPIVTAANFFEAKPYYLPAAITKKHYPRSANKNEVATLGLKATLLTSIRVPEDIVYAVTKEVFENLDRLKRQNRVLSPLTKPEMLTGLTAPLHPGVIKYFREKGLIK